MSDHVTMKLEGVEAITKAFKLLPPRMVKKHLRRSVNQGAALIRDLARQRAPVGTGKLRKNIISKGRRGKRTYLKSSVMIRVGPRTQQHDIATGKFMGGGDFRNDPKDSFYWRFIERGTKHFAAKPFIRPAVDSGFSRVVNKITKATTRGIINELQATKR